MNPETGEVRNLRADEILTLMSGGKLKPDVVLVNKPNPDCNRCHGKGSIHLTEGTRPERRRASKAGLPIWAKFLPCPECNPFDKK